MCTLQIYLFGTVHASLDDNSQQIRLTRTIQALLAYLLLQRNRTHPREVLANLFWGDNSEGHAHGALNTALWRLRSALEAAGKPKEAFLLINHLGEVGFNPCSDFWLDVAEFESSISPLLAHPAEHLSESDKCAAEKSLELYRGDLMDGFYDDWALRERERLRFLYLNALAFLMRHYKIHQAYEKSLVYGQRILSIDPLREEIHREMIQLYLDAGQRSLAIRQYEFCRKLLAEELNIAPMAETQALYSSAFSFPASLASLSASLDPQALRQLLTQLQQTSQTIETAHDQIHQLMKTINEMIH